MDVLQQEIIDILTKAGRGMNAREIHVQSELSEEISTTASELNCMVKQGVIRRRLEPYSNRAQYILQAPSSKTDQPQPSEDAVPEEQSVSLRERIRRHLTECGGPCTSAQITEALGEPGLAHKISKSLNNMADRGEIIRDAIGPRRRLWSRPSESDAPAASAEPARSQTSPAPTNPPQPEPPAPRLNGHATAHLMSAPTAGTPILMNDRVNHPSHYTQGKIECIDALESMATPAEFRAHCRLTAVKYAWRAPHKGCELDDYRKAAWYLERAAKSLDKERGHSELIGGEEARS